MTPSTTTLISGGETVQLTASASDSSGVSISGKMFTWSSSNDSVATVSSSGLVTAVADGSVTITATTDGINGTAAIKVNLDVLGDLASVYAELRNTLFGRSGGYYQVSELSSDELIVPTRGSDWWDQGKWLELHRHTWTANSASGIDDINSAWVQAYAGVTNANRLLEALGHAVAQQPVIEAELRTLRAFFYYTLMDLFGGVPIVTTSAVTASARNTRSGVFQFISGELNAARADLPQSWPAPEYERMTQGAADAILANMYLNAAVFTTDAPSATTYNSCTGVQVGGLTACAAAIAAADRILSSGQYSLATDWSSSFAPDNFTSLENILVVKHLNSSDLGM